MNLAHYDIDRVSGETHILTFTGKIATNNKEKLVLQLPYWRPGRYQHANYMRNLFNLELFDQDGKLLSFEKLSREKIQLTTKGCKEITISYQYHADELDAGSTYCDDTQIYINPVNCIFFDESEPDQAFSIFVKHPENYTCATALKKDGNFLMAKNFQELFDSPIIFSSNAIHETFAVDSVNFHVFIHGASQVNTKKIIESFEKFTIAQFQAFGDFPVKEYWYLIQIKPESFYHGVEHQTSTVIALGPKNTLNTPDGIQKLLEISSHELYHTWNVKFIRPTEMHPYIFSRENYSVCTYIAEGVTTYFGDQTLLRAGVLSQDWFNRDMGEKINGHIKARHTQNIPLAQAAQETWVDGYQKRKAGRDVNIYREGALVSFLLDAHIIINSKATKSLDTVMQALYNQAKLGKSYTEKDFINFCVQFGGKSVEPIFEKYVHQSESPLFELLEVLPKIGLQLEPKKAFADIKEMLGYETDKLDFITQLTETGEAKKAGVKRGDRIISINGKDNAKLSDLALNNNEPISLLLERDKKLVNAKIDAKNLGGTQLYQLSVLDNQDTETKQYFNFWKTRILTS
ncbi:MAG: M61 family metallopeptidase [Luteibaculaceae bacterium]